MVDPRLIDGYKLKRLMELQESCLIGARGFEPPTPCSQGRCAPRLRYAPINFFLNLTQTLMIDKKVLGLYKKVPYSVVPSDSEASTPHFVLPRVARHPSLRSERQYKGARGDNKKRWEPFPIEKVCY